LSRPEAARLVLGLLPLALLMGFSRPLAWKGAPGTISRKPTGGTVTNAPFLVLGENVDNQGCLAAQRLDAVMLVRVANATAAPLSIDPARAVFLVDGSAAPGRSGGEAGPSPAIVIQPGQTALVRAQRRAFLPKSDLERIERIEIVVPVGLAELRADFPGLKAVAVRRGGRFPAAIEAELR
jgi:hypothetical protein